MRKMIERAGIIGASPHTLRHTAATWMSKAGIDLQRIADYLGHEDVRTTKKTYDHHQPDYLEDAMEALDW